MPEDEIHGEGFTIKDRRTFDTEGKVKEEAKQEIRQLFPTGQTLYYSDIAEQLRLDLKLVVDICNEFQSKGEIEVVDDTTLRKR